MSGKHTQKKSNAPVGLIVLLVVIVLIVAVVVLFYFSQNKNTDINTDSSSASSETVQTEALSTYSSENSTLKDDDSTSQATSQTSETEQTTTKPSQSVQTTTEKVVVPDSDSDDESYFDASFTPYKAFDTDTQSNVSMREVFGSSYTGGTFVFYSDGIFKDNLSISFVNSGSYAVSGDTIRATYTNDKNITIGIVSSNGDIPTEIMINYGGYDVYFN